MTLNRQVPWTVVSASLPVQLSNTSVQLVWQESVKQLGTTPLNSCKRGKSWQRPCIEIRHVKKWWTLDQEKCRFCVSGVVTKTTTTKCLSCHSRREAGDVRCLSPPPPGPSGTSGLRAVIWFYLTISSLVLLPSPVTLSVLSFFCLLAHSPEFFQENSSVFFVKK